jgi:hypothetical protein
MVPEEKKQRLARIVAAKISSIPVQQSQRKTADAGTSSTAAKPALASNTDIEALDFGPVAKAAALELRKLHPSVKFTSGRRTRHEQAHAMASNIVSSGNRKWIAKVYISAVKLQKWVDDNPDATSVNDLTKGLEETLDNLTDREQAAVSKHLTGAAFDVHPVTEDGEAIKADIRKLSGLTKFLEREGGLNRWHAQF